MMILQPFQVNHPNHSMHCRTGESSDLESITALYRSVAQAGGGIARLAHEITEQYVENFLTKSLASGLIIVAEHPEDRGVLIGGIHAYRGDVEAFHHVLSHLTIVVHPDFQGRKVGRTLLTIFMEEIALNRPDIGKVELFARESNHRAIGLYQSLGFTIEGRMEMRIKTADGHYEADIPMGWQNPGFDPEHDGMALRS